MPLPPGRKAGRRHEAPSQDTGLIALVSSERFGALLRKEKDGASPPSCFFGGIRRMPSFSVLWNEGFLFKADGTAPRGVARPTVTASILKRIPFFHSGLSTKNRAAKKSCGTKLKDQS